MEFSLSILFLSFLIIGVSSFSSMLLLWPKSRKSRATRVTRNIMAAISFAFLFSISNYRVGQQFVLEPFNPINAFISNLCSCMMIFLSPIEFLKPGFLSLKRVTTYLLPYLSWGFVFFTVNAFTDNNIEARTLSEAIAQIHNFEIWGILGFYIIPYFYCAFILYNFFRYYKIYSQYVEDNYSNNEVYDIQWLRVATFMPVIMTLAFHFLVIEQSFTTHIIYTVIISGMIIGLSLKTISMDEITVVEPYLEKEEEENMNEEGIEEEELSRLQIQFKQEMNNWMESEKPFLNTKFQQNDVMQHFNISRSKASYMFKEIYTCSFSEFVAKYRVNEAQELLIDQPEMPIKEIAMQCGFNNHPSFTRTFIKTVGCSPAEYRLSNKL